MTKTFWGILAGILVVLAIEMIFMGLRGCEKSVTEMLKEPERVVPETAPDTVQLFVYQEGEKIPLDVNSLHFTKLQTLIEQRLISATDKYQGLGIPRSTVDLAAGSTAVEISYPEPKEFKMSATGEMISPTRLLVPIAGDPITTIYYALQNQDYIEGPYVSQQGTDDIKAILKSMNIEMKQPAQGVKPPEQSGKQYRLTVHATSWMNGTPIEKVPIEVVDKASGNIIAKKETNQNGVVEFTLPSGNYNYRVAQPSSFKGGGDIDLTQDTTKELKLLAVPQ